jgi:lipopolysaccharide/colanic/teichoic acid biosynthesis glycosyltransferase
MNKTLYAGFMIVKRIVDALVSLAALLILFPILFLIAIWIKLDSPGPAFYKSLRMGKDGRPFTLYKFRTMYQHSQPIRAEDGSYLVLDNDPRVTRVGRLLRIGFDELPQLFNVLLGHMSLIGPRADPPEAALYYDRSDEQRLSMKPGISGLAQVNGRTRISLAQRRAYDLAYVTHPSPALDTCIFCLTLFELLPFLNRGSRRAQRQLSRTAQHLVADTT